MSSPAPIARFHHELLLRGCPPARARRIAAETADHYDDLYRAALDHNLSAADASSQAAHDLGDPVALAQQHVAVLRQSSWWGRHPILGFGVLPFLVAPVLWLLWLALCVEGFVLLFFGGDSIACGRVVSDPRYYPFFTVGVQYLNVAGLALESLLICWLVRRFALDFRWAFLACAIVFFYGLVMWVSLAPHTFSIGAGVFSRLSRNPGLTFGKACVPLLIVALAYSLRRRAALAHLPARDA
jgi:hypothetical protein